MTEDIVGHGPNFTELAGEIVAAYVSNNPVPISERPNLIVSFIDGKTYKTLKRHLSANGLDPQSYRVRFGLPSDYPMVAPSYAAQRSALAKAIGLGVSGTRRSA
ncbi:MucR family transcriptional regulator [Heyndrickxia sporothermodurans]